MASKNKLDNVFGPIGHFSGIILFVAGLYVTYSSFTGLILVLLGAFVGFTTTSTTINFDKKMVRFSNNLFGIIPIGKWISIQPYMKIGIKKSNNVWRAYSRSNRTLDIADNDYRLILCDYDGKEIMQLQKYDILDSAKLDLDRISKQLGIGVF